MIESSISVDIMKLDIPNKDMNIDQILKNMPAFFISKKTVCINIC